VLNRAGSSDFNLVLKPRTADLDRQVLSPVTRVAVPVELGHQEARMWGRFAELCLGGKRDAFYPAVALRTQAVMDAAMASIAQGGARVPVPAVDVSKA
jgi:predicted dehydrogenase